jgi:hypothetical protein
MAQTSGKRVLKEPRGISRRPEVICQSNELGDGWFYAQTERKDGFLLTIALGVLVGLASAMVMLVFADTPPPPYYIVNDLNGANDEPGQKDLTRMGRYDDPAGYLDIFWSWDEGTTAVIRWMPARFLIAMATETSTTPSVEQSVPISSRQQRRQRRSPATIPTSSIV